MFVASMVQYIIVESLGNQLHTLADCVHLHIVHTGVV